VKLFPVRALLGGLAGLALLSGQAFAASPWLSYNAKAHTATLTIVAGYKGGFDFNGDSKGKMIVTIPVGTKVTVKFTNKASLPHSVLVTTWADRMAASGFATPFKGASSPNPSNGSAQNASVTFTFTANKVGSYAIVCAVPGHAIAGMWDTLKVVKGGSASIAL
jgi:sulfocyanin